MLGGAGCRGAQPGTCREGLCEELFLVLTAVCIGPSFYFWDVSSQCPSVMGTLREGSQFPDPSLFLPQCLHEGWEQWQSGRREEGKCGARKSIRDSQTGRD